MQTIGYVYSYFQLYKLGSNIISSVILLGEGIN